MKLKQNGKTINSYFIFIILLLLVIFGLNLLNNRTDEYTKAEFIADLDAGNVSEVVVQPNGEAPTGYLEIQMKNGVSHKLYATDITELETLVREYGFDPVVNDIERENWFLTYMLPMLVVLAVGTFLFMMMNAQQAGGGNGKMMNFGKSRAKMTLGDKSVTFAQVAGLKEEKEELEEIVDFLKEPGKYTGVGARIPKGVLLEGPPGTGTRTRNRLLGVRLSGAGRRRAHAERIGLLPDREGKRSGECAGIRTARLLGGDLLFGGGELYVLLSGCGACFRGLFPLRDGRRFETRSRECAARREERPAFGAGRFDGLYVPFVRRCGRKDL